MLQTKWRSKNPRNPATRLVFGMLITAAVIYAGLAAFRARFEMKDAALGLFTPPPSCTCSDRHAVEEPSVDKDRLYPELAAFLRKVAINNEVIMAVSNRNLAYTGGMLDVWITHVIRAGVRNAMVLALDDDTKAFSEGMGLSALTMDIEVPKNQKGNGDRGIVGTLKFVILRHALELGYSVLLSDVDVLVLQNPFDGLTRDSDIESMSDGWTPETAYGWNDVLDDEVMGWGRYAHSMRVFVFNVGFIYMRPTQAAIDLLDMVNERLSTEDGWDQSIFNECVFLPSRPGSKDPAVSRRVLDYEAYLNSKTLFKHLRYSGQHYIDHKPIVVHINSHPDKWERMLATIDRYVKGNLTALDHFPVGSE